MECRAINWDYVKILRVEDQRDEVSFNVRVLFMQWKQGEPMSGFRKHATRYLVPFTFKKSSTNGWLRGILIPGDGLV